MYVQLSRSLHFLPLTLTRSLFSQSWCGLCAQFVTALTKATSALTSLSTASISGDSVSSTAHIPPVYVLLISNGSHTLIPTYRARLDCPFPLYMDRSRKLYKALGMNKKSWNMGSDSEKGSYIVKSQLGNVTSSIAVCHPLYRPLFFPFVRRSKLKPPSSLFRPVWPCPLTPARKVNSVASSSSSTTRSRTTFDAATPHGCTRRGRTPRFVSFSSGFSSLLLRADPLPPSSQIKDIFLAAGVRLNEEDSASVYGGQ